MESQEQHRKQYDWLKGYQFVKGQSGNPGGRPVGSKSLKQFAREYLQSLPEEQKIEYLKTLPGELVWKMAEGMPETKGDITSGGEKIVPIYGGQSIDIQGHNSDQEDIPAQEEN